MEKALKTTGTAWEETHVVYQQTVDGLQPVVCLRGGERGTCLGPPLFGPPP